jgi:ribosomal protein L11 methyltransferase
MLENWIEIEIEVAGENVDLVSAGMMDLDCCGIIVEDRKLDTFTPPGYELDACQDYRIKAYFPEPQSPKLWRRQVEERLHLTANGIRGKPPVILSLRKVENEAWAENWKQNFCSFRVGKHLVFRPSWEQEETEPGKRVISLDPGMAFGTGTHATTRLCLESLNRLVEQGFPADRVLDVGTGSGILALAAAALGAGTVVGVDVDETACEVACRNVALNGFADRIRISQQSLSEIESQSDIILANSLAEENIRLAPELLRHLKKGGWLILSGILVEREPLIEKGFATFPLDFSAVTRLEDWACFTFRKKN